MKTKAITIRDDASPFQERINTRVSPLKQLTMRMAYYDSG